MSPSSSSTAEMVATREEMKRAKLDIGYRDFCAHLLIPLNECRRKSMYIPWKCEHERHVYEKCQYKEYVRDNFGVSLFCLTRESARAIAQRCSRLGLVVMIGTTDERGCVSRFV